MKPGPKNLLSDVPGLIVGHAHDAGLGSGVSVVLGEKPLGAACDIRGGGPGTREAAALALTGTIDVIHALVLSGGSAFGLDAASGAQAFLRERGIGLVLGPARVAIVPQAILFDLNNGGNKDWGRYPPYREMAYQACEDARAAFTLGSAGAGFGATTLNLRGGLGSASAVLENGTTIAALVAVNAAGSATIGQTRHFWAAPFECGSEFGGHGWPATMPADANSPMLKSAARPGTSTTLGVVATDAPLGKLELARLAIMAQTGLARALFPVHTPLDGDVVFAVSTRAGQPVEPIWGLAQLGAVAATVLARAVARGVYEAAADPAFAHPPAYQEAFAAHAPPPSNRPQGD
jgi:D-aminopeptidase